MTIDHRTKRNVATSTKYLCLFVWVAVCVVPIIMLMAASFKQTAIFASPPEILSLRGFTLDNYRVAMGFGDYMHHFQNSVITSFATIAVVCVTCVPMAYGLTKIRDRQRENVTFLILSMRFVPYVVLALPLYMLFITFGISGTRAGLVMAYLARQIPFAAWLLVGFFVSIPNEVIEAAIVDGCRPWQLFWKVSVPMVISGINAVMILTFIMAWNEYLFAVFLAGYDAQPLTVGITRFVGSQEMGAQYGVIAAYGVLIILPVVVFTVFANRRIVSGLTRGAVKG